MVFNTDFHPSLQKLCVTIKTWSVSINNQEIIDNSEHRIQILQLTLYIYHLFFVSEKKFISNDERGCHLISVRGIG